VQQLVSVFTSHVDSALDYLKSLQWCAVSICLCPYSELGRIFTSTRIGGEVRTHGNTSVISRHISAFEESTRRSRYPAPVACLSGNTGHFLPKSYHHDLLM
jgi:hypothetical protein